VGNSSGICCCHGVAGKGQELRLTYDVCLDGADLNTSDTVTVRGIVQPEFFAAAYSGFHLSVRHLRCCVIIEAFDRLHDFDHSSGAVFRQGSAVGNLPADASKSAPDIWLVEWYFRFNSGGAFSTMGPVVGVAAGGTYPQTITGAFGLDLHAWKDHAWKDKTTARGQAVYRPRRFHVFSCLVPRNNSRRRRRASSLRFALSVPSGMDRLSDSTSFGREDKPVI